MKAISFEICGLMLCVSTIALPQSETHKPHGQSLTRNRRPLKWRLLD